MLKKRSDSTHELGPTIKGRFAPQDGKICSTLYALPTKGSNQSSPPQYHLRNPGRGLDNRYKDLHGIDHVDDHKQAFHHCCYSCVSHDFHFNFHYSPGFVYNHYHASGKLHHNLQHQPRHDCLPHIYRLNPQSHNLRRLTVQQHNHHRQRRLRNSRHVPSHAIP